MNVIYAYNSKNLRYFWKYLATVAAKIKVFLKVDFSTLNSLISTNKSYSLKKVQSRIFFGDTGWTDDITSKS